MSQSWKEGTEKISCEIRNQLAVIKGSIFLSKEYTSVRGIDIDDYNECLDRIDKAIENINDIASLKELDKLPEKGEK